LINWLKDTLSRRNRISTQLYLAIGGAVLLTMAASLVGWLSFDRVGDVQGEVNERSVPSMAAAFGVARYGGVLVAAAPSLTAATTPEEFAQVSAGIDQAHEEFEKQLTLLESGGQDERFERIRSSADMLFTNIESIQEGMQEHYALAEQTDLLRQELIDLRVRLDATVTPIIDDQLFYTMTGYRALGAPADPREAHFSEAELANFRYLSELQSDANIATQLLASAFSLSSPSLIEPLRERFESAAGHLDRNLEALEDSPIHAELAPIFERLFDLSSGDQDGFDLLYRQLTLAERQVELLAANQGIAVDLVAAVDGLVAEARASVDQATQASSQAIFTGRTLLLSISAASVGGALLIAWLFVGRVLLRRLQMLSDWMRRMAGGDLESQVDIGGRDEVADMAAALEVFRRHALEVQRLNLVEKLAEELQGKNDELESVLGELRATQDQIVMREKLAALGELTAGVAHEIRNPLNFVRNFSEISEDLVAELQETLEQGGAQLTDEQRGLVQDISQELSANLERIRSHGDRANRIVQDMLSLSQGPGSPQPTDINTLLDEHTRLAYHSARAMDSDFQLDMQLDLDPDMGEVEVIPQDLGRVFLNMVSNACYATDQKRRAAREGDGDKNYMPTLYLATRRKEHQAEIRIKDNGDGIPQDVIDKIFNPFFTTKPADKGTGLGLAISNDIVRQHGGAIRVDTKPGQFTEMTLGIPLVAPVVAIPAEPGGSAEGA
jgi:signal transduction histidine kinase